MVFDCGRMFFFVGRMFPVVGRRSLLVARRLFDDDIAAIELAVDVRPGD